jgi:putative permease
VARELIRPNEKLQLAYLGLVTVLLVLVLFFTPALRPITLLTALNVLILGPWVRFLGRHRIPKVWAILLLYFILTVFTVFGITRLTQALAEQWAELIDALPGLELSALNKLGVLEAKFREKFGFELNLGVHAGVTQMGGSLRSWALTHVPSLIGSLASGAFLVPIFSFFVLKDGELFSSLYQSLIPARFSKRAGEVLSKIGASLGTFLRAKLLEAAIFGLMTYLGLRLIGAPYAGIFSVIGALSNIIPYLGPFIGAAPPLLIFGFSDAMYVHFWPAALMITIANLIDNFLIFPVFVAKIVNLTPLTLLISVAVGQELYGVLGMLLAVPVASILKIILVELRSLIYPDQETIKPS